MDAKSFPVFRIIECPVNVQKSKIITNNDLLAFPSKEQGFRGVNTQESDSACNQVREVAERSVIRVDRQNMAGGSKSMNIFVYHKDSA
jgi:hypothetical protein